MKTGGKKQCQGINFERYMLGETITVVDVKYHKRRRKRGGRETSGKTESERKATKSDSMRARKDNSNGDG